MLTVVADMIASQYMAGVHTQPTKAESEAFFRWLTEQYFNLPCRVKFVDAEVSPETMLHYYQFEQTLYISMLHSDDHPLLTPSQNWMFRAVHDYHHASKGFGFDATGEIQAALYAMSTAPAEIHWIIWSEVAMQACACVSTGEFQAQKLVKV